MKKTIIPLGALLMSCLSAFPAMGANDLTEKNWINHPEIKKVRAVVKNIHTGIARKIFRGKLRSFKYCEPYQDTIRVLYADRTNTPRKYHYEAGSGDSSLRWNLYYDRTGRIRFVYIQGGAANGTEIEHRIYFDTQGNRIWELQKLIAGPGYTFPSKPWPEKEIGFKPEQHYSSPNKCPETK